jgi:phosphopantetheine adenylyltransferase
MFAVEERIQMIERWRRWSNVECASTEGYVVGLARKQGARYLVRGVRSCTDIEGRLLSPI